MSTIHSKHIGIDIFQYVQDKLETIGILSNRILFIYFFY